jgi:hypothetical protein
MAGERFILLADMEGQVGVSEENWVIGIAASVVHVDAGSAAGAGPPKIVVRKEILERLSFRSLTKEKE